VNVTIRDHVTIGKRCVLGASALVLEDQPDFRSWHRAIRAVAGASTAFEACELGCLGAVSDWYSLLPEISHGRAAMRRCPRLFTWRDLFRVFYSSRDAEARSHVGWTDVEVSETPRIHGVSRQPVWCRR